MLLPREGSRLYGMAPPYILRICRTAPPAFPDGAVVGAEYGYGVNCRVHIISQILRGDRKGASDGCTRARCASARAPLVAKYVCSPISELELQVRWRLIAEELGCGGDCVGPGALDYLFHANVVLWGICYRPKSSHR